MDIDIPDVRIEVEAAFARYEMALVSNDVATLEDLFHDDPRTIRFGAGENLYGMDAIRAFRRTRSPLGLDRRLDQTVLTTYGRNFATTSTLFYRDSAPGKLGRQTQSWHIVYTRASFIAPRVTCPQKLPARLPEQYFND